MLDNKPHTHISLALVGLMWVFPFLYYRHQYPLTTFDQEWWGALLGVLAGTLLLTGDSWRRVPRIVHLPAALIVLVLLQSALGLMAYFDHALLYIQYLLFALLLILLGGKLRDCVGLDKLAIALAGFLLAGAELSALIGVLQQYRWHTPLDAVIVTKLFVNMYGNLAQYNHFADYTAMGLISLGLLFQQRRLSKGTVLLLVMPLLFVLTLSGSRSSWLYLLMVSGLSWWVGRHRPEFRPLLRYCLLLMAGFVAMHGMVQLPFLSSFVASGQGSVSTLQRFSGADAFGGVRLYLWHEAWRMFAQSPWLGAGFGQFAWLHFQMGPALQRAALPGLFNNAHNLLFQLAAEAGVAGLLILLGSIAVWLHGLRRVAMSAAHWWGYAVLGVLAIHSLLEYPLWYAYFLAIAAILLGALDETRFRLNSGNIGRMSIATLLLVGGLSLLQLQIGYQQLKTMQVKQGVLANRQIIERARDDLAASHNVLSPYADLFLASYIEVSEDHLQEKLALNSRLTRFAPIAPVVYRQSYLLAQNGQVGQAEKLFEQALWSYPANQEELQQLAKLAEKDPAHFAALLEFALQKEQEYAIAIHNQ